MNLESQILIYNNATFDNFDSNNEKIHCTLTSSMIHNILDAPKIMDYKIIYIILPQVKTFNF
jgi:predicted Zn-dependent protease with MMP-like domain